MAKIVWKVGDTPTGRYRSFSTRAWPMAYIGNKDGNAIAAIYAADDTSRSYRAAIAETTELIIRVMDWRGEKPAWRTLKARPVGVKAAKAIVTKFLAENADWIVE